MKSLMKFYCIDYRSMAECLNISQSGRLDNPLPGCLFFKLSTLVCGGSLLGRHEDGTFTLHWYLPRECNNIDITRRQRR